MIYFKEIFTSGYCTEKTLNYCSTVKGSPTNLTLLHAAIRHGNIEACRLILQSEYFDFDKHFFKAGFTDESSPTFFHCAILNAFEDFPMLLSAPPVELVKQMLSISNEEGYTPLELCFNFWRIDEASSSNKIQSIIHAILDMPHFVEDFFIEQPSKLVSILELAFDMENLDIVKKNNEFKVI